MGPLRYEAGARVCYPHLVSLDFQGRHFDVGTVDLLSRFVHSWCHRNCRSGWRLEEYHYMVYVFFENPRDVVLFKLTDYCAAA